MFESLVSRRGLLSGHPSALLARSRTGLFVLSIWMRMLTGTVFHSTEHGIYERRGGFPNMTVTYVHGDWLYNVLVRNGVRGS